MAMTMAVVLFKRTNRRDKYGVHPAKNQSNSLSASSQAATIFRIAAILAAAREERPRRREILYDVADSSRCGLEGRGPVGLRVRRAGLYGRPQPADHWRGAALADWKSAIRQVGNLRYLVCGSDARDDYR